MSIDWWPAGVLIGEYRDPVTDRLLPGKVTVDLPIRITSTVSTAIVIPTTLVDSRQFITDVDDTESFSIPIYATNTPEVEQIGWGWDITVNVDDRVIETYYGVQVLPGQTVNLRDLTPTEVERIK